MWGCGELRDHYETKRRENVYTIGGVEEVQYCCSNPSCLSYSSSMAVNYVAICQHRKPHAWFGNVCHLQLFSDTIL